MGSMSDDMMLSDGEVVRAVLEGRREMFRLLVRRYQDVLYRHALRMVGRPDDAADLVQRALVKGYQRLADCRDPDRVGGWLFRALSNLCKDFLKSPRREDLSIDGADATIVVEEGPADDAERSELRRSLNEALDRLGPEAREAFVMKHLEGRSYEEMATLLGASESALKMRVMRARDELRSLLEVYR